MVECLHSRFRDNRFKGFRWFRFRLGLWIWILANTFTVDAHPATGFGTNQSATPPAVRVQGGRTWSALSVNVDLRLDLATVATIWTTGCWAGIFWPRSVGPNTFGLTQANVLRTRFGVPETRLWSASSLAMQRRVEICRARGALTIPILAALGA